MPPLDDRVSGASTNGADAEPIIYRAVDSGHPRGGNVTLSKVKSIADEGGAVHPGCIDAMLYAFQTCFDDFAYLPLTIATSFRLTWLHKGSFQFDFDSMHLHSEYQPSDKMTHRYHSLLVYSFKPVETVPGIIASTQDTYYVGIVVHNFATLLTGSAQFCFKTLIDPFPEVLAAQPFHQQRLMASATKFIEALAVRDRNGRPLAIRPQWKIAQVQRPSHPSDSLFSIVAAIYAFSGKRKALETDALLDPEIVALGSQIRADLHQSLTSRHYKAVAAAKRSNLSRSSDAQSGDDGSSGGSEIERGEEDSGDAAHKRAKVEALIAQQRRCVVCEGERGEPNGAAKMCLACQRLRPLVGGDAFPPPLKRLRDNIDKLYVLEPRPRNLPGPSKAPRAPILFPAVIIPQIRKR